MAVEALGRAPMSLILKPAVRAGMELKSASQAPAQGAGGDGAPHKEQNGTTDDEEEGEHADEAGVHAEAVSSFRGIPIPP